MEIRTKTIGEAWIKACKLILRSGKNIKDGEKNLKELTNLLLVVKNPSQNDKIIEKKGDKKDIEWMTSNFLDLKRVPELKNALSYGVRLFNYKGKNQIRWVVNKLKQKPESKAATISMIMPEDENYIPCVSLLDFKIRQGKLNLYALCRAIDFGKKVYTNLLALNKIQMIVANKLDIQVGELAMFNVSAHIYEEDFKKIKEMAK